ncbi:hypothetical protein COCC4DRAFT_58523 [Bipolaris maydis ATCC 48331]|uniref:Uncharacterized protein n=1 Tax=Cochliobolus heterostrophus (strain C4 / ATCC 48331 / race T) TaxID=665024 RepID=N4X3P8_COCH4|nr:uncharacterized protein COCC4DRAFT_58523 [Bipolaris maydis ATCC 48331]ENI07629.1 hypothetical protein COCC4DRAFT_58523 [Bipolaris maydis ATCC 48331]
MFCTYLDPHTHPHPHRCCPSRRLGRAQTRALPWFSLAACRCFTLHAWQDTRRAFSAEQNAEALIATPRQHAGRQIFSGCTACMPCSRHCWLQRRSREPHVLFHHQPCHGSGTPDTTLVANPSPCSPLEIAHRAQPNPRNR